MNKKLDWKKLVKTSFKIFGILMLLIILIPVTSKKDTPKNDLPETTVMSIDDKIQKIIADNKGSTGMSFKSLKPSDNSKFATVVEINISDFLSPTYLYKNTGKVTSDIFKEVFASKPEIKDIVVWYYADIKDVYGNTKNDIIISQAMDRNTYLKINWENFDKEKLCDFLKNEGLKNDNNTTCVIKVNLK